ncbi:MAG: histidine kinase [Deltaproteobacteria bacterium]|nr:histidine kinase [Deltaproteobacteria bacterium]
MSGFALQARRWVMVALAMVACVVDIPAPVAAPAGWQKRTFDGVLSVQSIVQTADHHLWVAGTDGVQRFDGVAWTPVTGLPPGPARRLLATTEGVWVATGGGFLERYPDGNAPLRVRFRTEQPELFLVQARQATHVDLTALPSPWVWALAQRPGTQEVWLGTEGGVARMSTSPNGPPQKPQLIVSAAQLPAAFVTSLLFVDARHVWIGTSRGLALGTINAAGKVDVGSPVLNGVINLAQNADRHLLASTCDGVFDVSGNNVTKLQDAGDGMSPFVVSPEGTLIGMHNGTPLRFEPGRPAAFGQVQVHDALTALRDHEGSYWFGVRSGPVTQVFQPPVRNLGPPEGLLGEVAFSIHRAHDDSLWITTTKGIVHSVDNKLIGFRYGSELPVWSARSIAESSNHALYFSADNAVLRYAKGAFQRLSHTEGLRDDFVRSVYVDATDALWIGWEHHGLSTFPNATITAATRRDLVGVCIGPQIFAGEAPRGTLWWSAGPQGVTRVQSRNGQTEAHCFVGELGLQRNEVTAVTQAPNGSVWAATMGRISMARWHDDKFTPLPADCGVAAGGFFSLTTTGDRVWATSNRGVYRATWSELEDCMDGKRKDVRWFRIDEQSGMRSPICIAAFPPLVALDSASALWFSTTAGISIIEANQTQAPPQAVLEGFAINGRAVADLAHAQVPPKPQSLQWSWTAPEFILPQAVRFRYQLQGLDRDWIDGGQERSARYGVIPPGDYTFRVQAYVAGVGAQTAAISESHIHVQPSLAQSWWFRTLIVLLVACAAFLWHRLRLSQLAARHRAVHEERSRLAREIHDGLGQAFLGVRFHLDGLDHLLGKRGRDERESQLLDESRHILTRAEAELRETIWDLRATTLARPNLKTVLETQCSRLSNNLGRPVRFHWEGEMVPASGLREHELPRVVEEAVTNAVRHGDAPVVDVHAECNADGLRLIIRNAPGAAKPPADDRPGFGLVGMQERAHRMGGTFAAQPLADGGFEVTLHIPTAQLHNHA